MRLFAGIACVSAAALAYEVALTRLLAVKLFPAVAFLVVSIALLGVGAAGTALAVTRRWRTAPPASLYWGLALAFGLLAPSTYLLVNALELRPFWAGVSLGQVGVLFLMYVVLALPFFCSGALVAAALARERARLSPVYRADLLGAGVGGLLGAGLIWGLGPNAVAGAAGAALFGALWFSASGRQRLVASGAILAVLLVAWSGAFAPRLSEYKDLSRLLARPEAELLSTAYTPLGRVDVFDSPAYHFAPGLALSAGGRPPRLPGISLDGMAVGSVGNFSAEAYRALPHAVLYTLRERPRVLTMSPGGGLDLGMAAAFNASAEAIEANPAVASILAKEYGAVVRSGHPRVFMARAARRYDAVVVGLWGDPLASGPSGLGDSADLTVEALRAYRDALEEDGLLVVTRYLANPPREEVRVLAAALRVFPDLEARLAIFRSLTTVTLLVKNRPWSPDELEKIRGFARERQYDLVFLPGLRAEESNQFNRYPDPVYFDAVRGMLDDPGAFARGYLFDVRPATDDRPFFSNFATLGKLPGLWRAKRGSWVPFLDGGVLVVFLLLQALVLSLLFILGPLRLFRGSEQLPAKAALYFVLLGAGFVFLEVGLIHRLGLWVAPPLAVAFVVAVLLVGAGLGAGVSARLSGPTWRKVLLSAAASALVLAAGLGAGLEAGLAWPGPMRYVALVSLLLAVGFVLGMPFPAGLRRLTKTPAQVAWAWALNGAATVVGAALAFLLAIEYGYAAVFGGAGACYLVAWLCTRR